MYLMEEGKKRGIAMAESMASRIVDPLLARDYLRLSFIVNETGDALYTFIQDISGNVISHSFVKGDLVPAQLAGNSTACWELVHCRVFQSCAGDEIQNLTETFDFMAYTLQERILELHATQLNLTQQQHLLSTVLDMNPDRVSMVDTRMVYQTANRTFAQSVGREIAEIQGCSDFSLFPEEEAERRNLEGRMVLTSGSRVDRQEKLETADDTKWFHVVQIPVLNERGSITGLLRMDRDITNIKEYEQQLLQAQKMESIGKLAGGVAHEINTPPGHHPWLLPAAPRRDRGGPGNRRFENH